MKNINIQKALDVFVSDIEKEIDSLKKQLEICQTETNLYKKLLEEKDQTQDNTTLYILEFRLKNYFRSRVCIGVFTLESMVLKAILQGLKKSDVKLSRFDIYPVVIKTPYTKESEVSVLITELDEYEGEYEFICGIKVNDQVYPLGSLDTDDHVYEKVTVNKVNDDHFDW